MRIRIGFFMIYQLLFTLWCSRVHSHFFEFSIADKVGLFLASVVPLSLWRFRAQKNQALSCIILLVSPAIIFPLIEWLIQYFDDMWVVIYIFIILTGICAMGDLKTVPMAICMIFVLSVWVVPYTFMPNQKLYFDRVVYTLKTRKGEADIVSWHNNHWVYYNNQLQISTEDGHIHAEILAHISGSFHEDATILLIGGDHGMTSVELNKYGSKTIDHIPYDSALLNYMLESNIIPNLSPDRFNLITENPFRHLSNGQKVYDLIVVDMPDPLTVEYEQFYQTPFYELCLKYLSKEGVLITNSGTVFPDRKVVSSVSRQLKLAGIEPVELQAQIPTLGHRSWLIGSRVRLNLDSIRITVPTKWISTEAIEMMKSWRGKPNYPIEKHQVLPLVITLCLIPCT